MMKRLAQQTQKEICQFSQLLTFFSGLVGAAFLYHTQILRNVESFMPNVATVTIHSTILDINKYVV